MTTKSKQAIIRNTLLERAESIITEVKRCHILGNSYDWERTYERAYCNDAEAINAWQDLLLEIELTECELENTPRHIDWETGYPTGRYDVLSEYLADLQDDAEEWASLYEAEYNKLWDALEMALYPEEG